MKKLHVLQVLDPDRSNIGEPAYVYKVTKVTNSVKPNIGESLTPERLNDYCNDEDWDTVIT